MPSMKKTGYAYLICGVLFVVLTLVLGVEGWKFIGGIAVGVVLTVLGLIISSKK